MSEKLWLGSFLATYRKLINQDSDVITVEFNDLIKDADK